MSGQRWMCGGYDCGEIVEGGDADKLTHLKTRHPDLYGMLWVPVQPDARTPKVDERPAADCGKATT